MVCLFVFICVIYLFTFFFYYYYFFLAQRPGLSTELPNCHGSFTSPCGKIMQKD
ncbi:hypothetical protein BO71DRAFT_162573 [Aspergillus ellipticus CBS 707.79]|uniref:Uncharacterized protein n=1 Tax=Aspergillus ellipticus CBS 707.79 TaxID=1448320 RepID=A0A319CSU0_9EURO|nr:hypothetical protein BO71DRAFT_162573 [Aspergillus ellipticus CBS 707.79]